MFYSISEVAKMFNLSIETLRYYENEQIIPPIAKDASGKRIYSDIDLEWIDVICCFKKAGMKISEIKEYINLCNLGKESIQDRYNLILHTKASLEKQIASLNEAYKHINEKQAYYELKMQNNEDAINPKTRKR